MICVKDTSAKERARSKTTVQERAKFLSPAPDIEAGARDALELPRQASGSCVGFPLSISLCLATHQTKRLHSMKTPFAVLAMIASLAVFGCIEPTIDATAVGNTGGNLSGTTATNCRAAIAGQTNLPVGDVAVFDVAESEAGNTAQATVAGADAPWICRTNSSGKVLQVMYSGSEGTL